MTILARGWLPADFPQFLENRTMVRTAAVLIGALVCVATNVLTAHGSQEAPEGALMDTAQHDRESNAIDGAPTLGWDRDRGCTFVGALEAALRVTDHPISYTDVMGWTGLAFRVRRWHDAAGQYWDPSSAYGEMPDELTALRNTTGWLIRYEWRPYDQDMPRFTEDIAGSIDEGMPGRCIAW